MRDSKSIQIFRPGRHVAMSGDVLDFTEADLAACAAAYDPAKHEAPIVVGHPKLDAPAYGWAKSLVFAGALEAEPHQVEPAFGEMVAAGRFKKISASFFSPTSPQNPVPGVWYLRHIGFLGAQPPAVKGLRAPEFAAGEEGVVEFADWGELQNASLWRRMRDFLIAQFGLEKADTVIPDYTIGSLEEAARDDAPASLSGFSEPPTKEAAVTPEEKAALEAENTQLKQDIADRTAREKAAAATARHAGHASFAEAQVAAGRLTPAQQGVVVAALDALADAPIEFATGEGGDGKKPLAEAFKDFLAALPVQVEFGEAATKARAGTATATAEFAAPAGFSVDGEAAALHRKALAHQAQHQVDYLTAIRAVSI